jgi:hypothetical protein
MSTISTSDAFDGFAEDLLAERTARPLIIVGASKVDQLLFEILNLHLLPKLAKGQDQDELLEGDTPLATFSARIKMCYRLGLIDKKLCTALDKLRKLRNPSAHWIAFDITKSPMRELVADLHQHIASRHSFRLTKQRYFDGTQFNEIEELQCVLLTLCVLLEAIRKKTTTTVGNKIALSIAAR